MPDIPFDGAALRRLRKQRGYRSVAAYADQIQRSKWHLYEIERGEVAPGANVYADILAFFGLTPGDLLHTPEDPAAQDVSVGV